jgi:hypothetical protein
MGGVMYGFTINSLAPFDIPSIDNRMKFIESPDGLHFRSIIHVIPSEDGGQFACVDPRIGGVLELLAARGAKRGEDYLVTCGEKKDQLMFTLHVVPGFISPEDLGGWDVRKRV